MNRIPSLLLLFVFAFGMLSCGDSEIDTAILPNTYEADYDKCYALGLHNTHFKVDYPDGVVVLEPDNNRDFISFRYLVDGVIAEELWIGGTNIKKSEESRYPLMIEQMVQLHEYYSPVEVDFMGRREFFGQQTHMARVITDFAAYQTPEYAGEYMAMFTLPQPIFSEEHHAVRVTMLAGENSEIKSFEDFETKGIVSQIYKTLRYVEGDLE